MLVVQLRKLLFSATLTHNPAKLAALQLHYPLYFRFSATLKYNTPTTLTVRESRQRASERERADTVGTGTHGSVQRRGEARRSQVSLGPSQLPAGAVLHVVGRIDPSVCCGDDHCQWRLLADIGIGQDCSGCSN